jgi:hypothetical protein
MQAVFIICNLVIGMIAVSFVLSSVSAQSNDDDINIEIPIPEAPEHFKNKPESPQQPQPSPEPQPQPAPTPQQPPIIVDPKDKSKLDGIFGGEGFESMVKRGGIGAVVFGFIGSVAGGKDGYKWGAIAGTAGGIVWSLLETQTKLGAGKSFLIGLGVASAIFLLTYKKETEEVVEFYCLPWQAPVGGEDCQLCNEYEHCSEYMCKSLGQACDIINPGTKDQKCIWKNPQDVNSPLIKILSVNKGHKIIPNTAVRPPATGVIIEQENQKCIKAFFPLEFTFTTRDSASGIGEPSQCKVDYNLTKSFKDMQYFVGGDELFKYNHTEKLSLPGPAALNAVAPELKNDGEYTLFIRCQDANGNFNQDAFSVNFCVEKGPDTTPPLIVTTNVPSGNPVKYNQTSLDLEVYVNEPSECTWSRDDRDYENMENSMSCSTQLWEMNNQQVYTCTTTLTGIRDRKEHTFYFKCKDQPWARDAERNENKQSYIYTVIGTQPLNILSLTPNGTIFGSTDTISVTLEVKTDNGYKNGEALCYYYHDLQNLPPKQEEQYVLFHETKANVHTQRQDLREGNYKYFIKCVDLGGNAVYSSTTFTVNVDRQSPVVTRVYREGDLKIITHEASTCSYSHSDCNFEIESGIKMTTTNSRSHSALWSLNKNYYIRCKDRYDNQPNPNSCSIIVKPAQLMTQEKKSETFDFSF